jgi:DNA polymerase-3 subunit beta
MEEKIIFKVSKDDILNHLVKVSKVVRDKATLPVYTYILFEVMDNHLRITGTDTEIQIESNIQLNESSGNLSFCADKSIIASLKTLSEQPLTFEATKRTTIDEKTKRKTVSVSINIIHASGNININGNDSEYFTKMKNIDGDSFDIPVSNFRRGLEKTQKFASDDQLRPVVCSVYCDVKEDCIVFVGANGNSVSRFEDFELKGITSGPLNIGNEVIGVLMPILDRAAEETLKITSSQSSIQMRIGDTAVTFRLVEGTYVKYNSVFPTDSAMTATVEVKPLSVALGRLLTVSEKTHNSIIMDIDSLTMNLSAKDDSSGKSANESLICTSTGQMKIGINASKMSDVLSVIDDSAVISFTDPERAIIITPEQQEENTILTLLCMPLLLTE